MNVGLFIPYYVDQFYPGTAIATLQLFEKPGLTVSYPKNQACCSQPMANSSFKHLTGGCNELFKNFSALAYIVASSAAVFYILQRLIEHDYIFNQLTVRLI